VTEASVKITVLADGALRVEGPVSIVLESGEVVFKEKCSLCRCGRTKRPPFCDTSHRDPATA